MKPAERYHSQSVYHDAGSHTSKSHGETVGKLTTSAVASESFPPSTTATSSTMTKASVEESDQSFPLLEPLRLLSQRSQDDSQLGMGLECEARDDFVEHGPIYENMQDINRPIINPTVMYNERFRNEGYEQSASNFLVPSSVNQSGSSPSGRPNEASEGFDSRRKSYYIEMDDEVDAALEEESFVADAPEIVHPEDGERHQSYRNDISPSRDLQSEAPKNSTRRTYGSSHEKPAKNYQGEPDSVPLRGGKKNPQINIIRASGDFGPNRERVYQLPLPEPGSKPDTAPKPVPTTARPLSSSQAVLLARNKLTKYELGEIKKFSEIYYTGTNSRKIEAREVRNGPGFKNFGFDDMEDNYVPIVHDHILYRYQIIGVLGKGSFCRMVKAFDHKRKRFVAIKMIKNDDRFKSLIMDEIKILEHLRRTDTRNTANVVHILGHFVFRSHNCITFELLHMSLYDYLKKTMFRGIHMERVARVAVGILTCLLVLNELKIAHCDLKPENVLLVKENSDDIKVQ